MSAFCGSLFHSPSIFVCFCASHGARGTLTGRICAKNAFFTQDLPVQSDIPQGASG